MSKSCNGTSLASQEQEKVEKLLNAQMRVCCNILQLKEQTARNFQASNNDVLTIYGLRKYHKPYINPVMGLPTQLVCGTNIFNNYRLSYFPSKIL